MLSAAQEPLSRDVLAAAISIPSRDLNIRLLPVRPLLKEIPTPALVFTFWHKSVADWLIDVERAGSTFTVDPDEGHRLLAQFCIQEVERLKQNNPIAQRTDAGCAIYATDHFAALKDWNSYPRLLNDDFYFDLCYGAAFLSGVGMRDEYRVELPSTAKEMPTAWQVAFAIANAERFLRAARSLVQRHHLNALPDDNGKTQERLWETDPAAYKTLSAACFTLLFQASRILAYARLAFSLDQIQGAVSAKALISSAGDIFGLVEEWSLPRRTGFTGKIEDQAYDLYNQFVRQLPP